MPTFNTRFLGLGRWLSQWGVGCMSMKIWVCLPNSHVKSQAHQYEAVFLELGKQSQRSPGPAMSPNTVREPYSKTKMQGVWEGTRYQPLTYTANTHAHASLHMCVQTSTHTWADACTHTKLKITKLSEISSSYQGWSLVSPVVLKSMFEFIL